MGAMDATKPSVLVAFRAENVRSFRDELELSLVATSLSASEPWARRSVQWREGGRPIDVLPAAGIFGANASGKSNVLRAMADMRGFVLNSFRRGRPTGGLPRRPFLLGDDSAMYPTRFEIDIVLCGVRHEYGFEYDSEQVLEEWAVRYPKGRAVSLFRRTGNVVEFGSSERAKSRAVRELLRPNALFLSTAASANHPDLLPLYAWFERNLLLVEAQSRDSRQALTTAMLDEPDQRERVLEFLRAADLGITGAARRELDPEIKARVERAFQILWEGEGDDANGAPSMELDAVGVHLTHHGSAGDIEFHPQDESLGTLVWFGLVGPVIQALRDGAVFLADELDSSLHPALVAEIVSLFQSPGTNPRRAQLIFNSHDTTILGTSAGTGATQTTSGRLLGRDQIWFTEKSNDGASRLYPLTELDPRKGEAIEQRYLSGRYGATPIISRPQFQAAAELVTSGQSEAE
jgi:hypothetical protein